MISLNRHTSREVMEIKGIAELKAFFCSSACSFAGRGILVFGMVARARPNEGKGIEFRVSTDALLAALAAADFSRGWKLTEAIHVPPRRVSDA